MQKSKLSILTAMILPALFSTSALAVNATDATVASPKIFDEVVTISSGEIDTDLIDLVLNGGGGNGDGDGGGN